MDRLGDGEKPGDVRAEHQVARVAVLLGGLVAARVDTAHDLRQAGLSVLERPPVSRGVLLHLQRRRRDTAGVGRLTWPEAHTGFRSTRTAAGVVGMFAPSTTI